jgi:hypothetical protein
VTDTQAVVRNVGTCSLMSREPSKWKPHKDVSINARSRDGPERSSDETSVMGVERRSPDHPVFIYRSTNDLGGTHE